jgi:hypothetical protein
MEMDVLQLPPTNINRREATQFIVRDFPSDKLGLSEEFCSNDIYKGISNRNPLHTLAYIKHGCNPHIVCKKTGNTLLHVIMAEANPMNETKYVPFVYQLSYVNINLDAVNKDGLNPLQMSIKMHLLELMIALIKCGAECDIEKDLNLITSASGPVEYEFRAAYRKLAPGYWQPVEEDHAFKVNVLVKSWCRINIQKNGKTLIEFAKEKCAQDKIVKMLIDNEVTIEFAHATISGDAQRMQSLSQHYKVDLDAKDYSHRENFFEPYCPLTLYGAALKYGHRHVLFLLKYSGDVSVKHLRYDKEAPAESTQSAVCSIL